MNIKTGVIQVFAVLSVKSTFVQNGIRVQKIVFIIDYSIRIHHKYNIIVKRNIAVIIVQQHLFYKLNIGFVFGDAARH
jgi:hypothetical protein